MTEITIRQAQATDAAQWRELRLEGLKTHPDAFGSNYESSALHPLSVWEKRLTPTEYDAVYVAVADGQLVATTGIFRENNPKLQHSGTIWGVYIKPEWRGKHLPDQLIQHCIEWAQARAVRILKLGVASRNIPAMRCYLRCGFSVYGIEPEVIYVDGVYHDELLMMRRL